MKPKCPKLTQPWACFTIDFWFRVLIRYRAKNISRTRNTRRARRTRQKSEDIGQEKGIAGGDPQKTTDDKKQTLASKKAQQGRRNFSYHQRAVLEKLFQENSLPPGPKKLEAAKTLGLSKKQVGTTYTLESILNTPPPKPLNSRPG